MIRLDQSDYQQGESFQFWWRWTNPNWSVLPQSDLAQIHPLTEEKAKEVWELVFVYTKELWKYAHQDTSGSITSSSLFNWIQQIDITAEETGSVQETLKTLEPQGDQVVVVMWEPTIAVAVPWHIFYDYWDDFCYPSSDDVSVWPVSGLWCLQYHHEDQVIFGSIRLPFTNKASPEAHAVPAKPFIPSADLLRLIRANQLVEATKLYHQETGGTYREAVDAVKQLAVEIQNENELF